MISVMLVILVLLAGIAIVYGVVFLVFMVLSMFLVTAGVFLVLLSSVSGVYNASCF